MTMKKLNIAKGASLLLIIVLITPSVSALITNNLMHSTLMEGTTWYVPDDFPTISKATDSDLVKDGDTIYVRSGTYNEFVHFSDKVINVIGENKETTFINGEVLMRTSSARLSGFTITGEFYGVHLMYGNNGNVITDNIIKNSKWGIWMEFCDSNIITGNIITGNKNVGINLHSARYNTVTNNIISGNEMGIALQVANWNTIGGEADLKNVIKDNKLGINIELSVYSRTDLKRNNEFDNNKKDIGGLFSRNIDGNEFLIKILEQFPLLQRLLNL